MKPISPLSTRARNVLRRAGLPEEKSLSGIVADAIKQGTTPLGQRLKSIQGCGEKVFAEICLWAGVSPRDAKISPINPHHVCLLLSCAEAGLLDKLCARTGLSREELLRQYAADTNAVRMDIKGARAQAAVFATNWLMTNDPTLLFAYPDQFQAKVSWLSEFGADYAFALKC